MEVVCGHAPCHLLHGISRICQCLLSSSKPQCRIGCHGESYWTYT